MELKYAKLPEHQGGSAVPDCGTIHQTEIRETLDKLSLDLKTPFNFNDYTLGSTGTREYSGDIDVVVDTKFYDIPDFREKLEEKFGKECVARNGNMLHLRYPIVGYSPSHGYVLPRTGYVQVDFNFGDPDWERFYHYSPGRTSEYKGAHRNLMISAICAAVNIDLHIEPNSLGIPYTAEYDGYQRPTSIDRWKFSQEGFTRVNRVSQKAKDGTWMRKQVDNIIAGPFKDPDVIRGVLFMYDPRPEDLDSLETLMDAVKRNYGLTDQERVWKKAAYNFFDWKEGRIFLYPVEITKYIPTDDK